MRPLVSEMANAHGLQEFHRITRPVQGKADVLSQGHVREKRIFLGEKTDAAMAGMRVPAGGGVVPASAVEVDASVVNPFQSSETAQGRGFARPGWAGQDHRGAGGAAQTYLQRVLSQPFDQHRIQAEAASRRMWHHALWAPDCRIVSMISTSCSGQVIIGQ